MPPGGDFLLGTDLLGRDLFTRMLYGARTSLVIGVVANGAALTDRHAGRASPPATSAAGSARS